MKKSVVLLGAGIILCGAIIGAISVSQSLAALVGGSSISVSQFEKQFSIFDHYSDVLQKSQGLSSETDEQVRFELRRLTLDSLIEQELIKTELLGRLGEVELGIQVDAKLKASTSTALLSDAVEALYGVSAQEFEIRMLVPIARQEILLDQFSGDVSALESWLERAREGAVVKLYTEDLIWSGKEVIKKE